MMLSRANHPDAAIWFYNDSNKVTLHTAFVETTSTLLASTPMSTLYASGALSALASSVATTLPTICVTQPPACTA